MHIQVNVTKVEMQKYGKIIIIIIESKKETFTSKCNKIIHIHI